MKFKSPEERPQESRNGGDFIKIKDGEAVTFIPRGEIYEFYSKFGVKGEVAPGTEGARLRYRVNAVVYENDEFKAKILEFGAKLYDDFYAASEAFDVTTMKFRLSRKGSTKEDTKYHLFPAMKEPLTQAQLAAIAKVDLHILDKGQSPPPQSDDGPPESWRGF